MKKHLTPLVEFQSGLSNDEFIEAISQGMFSVREDVREILDKTVFPIKRGEGVTKLVALSLSDLGFSHEPFLYEFLTEKFIRNWSRQNLRRQQLLFCEPSDAVHLLLQYSNDNKDWFTMGMEPFLFKEGFPAVFTLSKNPYGNRWLHIQYANLNRLEAGPMTRGSSLDNLIANVMETRYRLCEKWIFRVVDKHLELI